MQSLQAAALRGALAASRGPGRGPGRIVGRLVGTLLGLPGGIRLRSRVIGLGIRRVHVAAGQR